MPRTMFGSSYPPGCHGTPHDQDDGVTELQDQVAILLETAGISQETCDKIMHLIRNAERARAENNATSMETSDDH